MTRAGTKTTVKRQDVKKRKMENIYKEVTRLTKDKKVADKLIAKYGVDCAYNIVRESMQAPGDVMKRMGYTQWKNSADTIKFFVGANLNDAAIAKGIRKTQTFVAESKKTVVSTPRQVAKKNPRVKQAAAKAQTNNQAVIRKTQQREIAKTKSAAKTTVPLSPNILQTEMQKSNPFVFESPLTQAMKVETKPFNMFQAPKLTIEQQVEKELEQMKKDNPNGITLGSLKNDGFSVNAQTIKESDFQYLHAGKDGNGLGNAVQAVANPENVKGAGQCGQAVRKGYCNYMRQAYKEENFPKAESNQWNFYGRYCITPNGQPSNAAADLWRAFENDHFTVLRYPSGKSGNPSLDNLPNGTTVFFEAHRDLNWEKKNNASRHPGHTATYNNGKWYQGNGPHKPHNPITGSRYASYGSHYRIAIANDTKVDDELARKIIRAKIEENERLAQNVQARNAAKGRA